MANYLYNGVELPALPASALQVALMLASSAAQTLTFCTAAPTVSGETIVWADGARQHYQLIDGAWVLQLEDTGDGIVGDLNNGIAWCNVDILYADGTVYLAGSEPVPVKWSGLKSWLMGFALGLAGKPLPLAVKTPVAYLYNGVRLSALPEWDRETYPYAFIYKTGLTDIYGLVICTSQPYYSNNGVYIDGENLVTIARTSEETETPTSKGGGCYGNALWTNHDILNEDGSVYLAASDPVPVYE